MASRNDNKPALTIRDLHVYYGQSHAIQGVNLELQSGVLSVVGRNGMGKTTLCNTIMGLVESHSGSVRIRGREVRNRAPDQIANFGVGYVPQGRRVWPSLTVEEHLRLASRGDDEASWTIERIYQTFPRLDERRASGGAQLSGGEQQMLAISRALLGNPDLLIMDEPTEGLAPVVVQQVKAMLTELTAQDDHSVLLIEQNIGVATEVSENVAIMVNGRINRIIPAAQLANDTALQQSLLGVGRHSDLEPDEEIPAEAPIATGAPPRIFEHTQRNAETPDRYAGNDQPVYRSSVVSPNRWGTNFPSVSQSIETRANTTSSTNNLNVTSLTTAEQFGRTALVAGTFDTKAQELFFIRDLLKERGLRTRTVDLSTSGASSRADVMPNEVASCHPGGSAGVFSGERGSAVNGMAVAFELWIRRQRDIGGIISAGGSGGTALATPAMRALPVGIPKLMVSTVASGDVSPYVGPSDIMMMHSVADVQGINRISRQILTNAANAMAGMIVEAPTADERRNILAEAKPALGITMFGVTTPCVQALTEQLHNYDCLVFHATGTGGRSMENLADSGALAAIIDVTTTELADMLVGGVFAADEDRFGAVIRTRIPFVGSCGALDMVNFGALDTVPQQFRNRNLHVHNPQVTLMRTTRDENAQIGRWLGERLNMMEGAVRFLIPEGGVSLLDTPGQPFHDPEADNALFEAIENTVRVSNNRRVIRVPANVNDAVFVGRLIESFNEIHNPERRRA